MLVHLQCVVKQGGGGGVSQHQLLGAVNHHPHQYMIGDYMINPSALPGNSILPAAAAGAGSAAMANMLHYKPAPSQHDL